MRMGIALTIVFLLLVACNTTVDYDDQAIEHNETIDPQPPAPILKEIPQPGADEPADESTDDEVDEEVIRMQLTSSAFEHKSDMPSMYTCDGKNINPPLTVADVPEGAQSLVLIMDDPDAPTGTWDHWILFNIPPETATIAEGIAPKGVPGKNGWGRFNYGGPCPPSGKHRYVFKLYALNNQLIVPGGADKQTIMNAMNGHILAKTELIGLYERQ